MSAKPSRAVDARLPVAIANCLIVIAAGSVIATVALHWRSLGTLFVAPDVALIYLVSSIPLAASVLLRLRHSVGATAAVLIPTAGAAFVSIAAISAGSATSSTFAANLLRTGMTVSFVLSVTILVRIVDRGKEQASAPVPPIASLGLGLLVLALLPTVSVAARCQHETTALISLIEQSRFGEARQLNQALLALSPSSDVRGRSLKRLALEIDRELNLLKSQLAAIGADPELPQRRLERCRLLAMLGQSDKALQELLPLRQTPVSPAANDLCGTICESTAHWTAARDYHHQARADWLRQLPSPARTAGIFRATTRIAYCYRKLGDYELAEAAYREALLQSPTAQTHFLLAQFYEDMQQAQQARDHARQAMSLAPQQYQRAGSALIDKLTVGHFGCLSVHFAEASRSQQQTGMPDAERDR